MSAMQKSPKGWRWPLRKDIAVYPASEKVLRKIQSPLALATGTDRVSIYSVPEMNDLWGC